MKKAQDELLHFDGPSGQILSYSMAPENKESTGNVVWESGMTLAKYFIQRKKMKFEKKDMS